MAFQKSHSEQEKGVRNMHQRNIKQVILLKKTNPKHKNKIKKTKQTETHQKNQMK